MRGKRSGRQRRGGGMTLVSVVGATSLLLFLGILAAQMGFFQAGFAARFRAGTLARYAAEAGIAEGLARLKGDPAWGAGGETLTRTLPGGAPGSRQPASRYTVTFAGGGDPYSTNNLSGNTIVRGYRGTPVPPYSALLLSTGRSGGQSRTVEVLVSRSQYEFVVAASGVIRSPNAPLWAVGARTVEEALSGQFVAPANIRANGRGNEAILAGKETFVTGSLGASGEIVLTPPFKVHGGIHQNVTPAALPVLDPTPLDPGTGPRTIPILDETTQQLVVQTIMRREGDLEVKGPLTLSNGILYVTRDLVVNGAVTGGGAVMVAGKVKIREGASLSATNQVALLAGGDVVLEGRYDYFQGLVATRGNLTARRVTIFGAIVANSPDPEKGNVTLNDAKLMYTPRAVTQQISVPRPKPAVVGPSVDLALSSIPPPPNPSGATETVPGQGTTTTSAGATGTVPGQGTTTTTATSSSQSANADLYDLSVQRFITTGGELRPIYWRDR